MSFGNYPLVSVVMITYGHEKYISQAIDGVLAQKYKGEIELIVANDHSPDSTEEIVLEIIRNNQNGSWIKYTNHEENMGMMKNFIWALSQSNGKYIALCEGDDYWIDPLKLQKQLDYMEANPDYSLCFHASEDVPKSKRNAFIRRARFSSGTYSSEEILLSEGSFVPTASMFFERKFIEKLPSWFIRAPAGDFALSIYLAEMGKVWYIDELMTAYRVGTPGSWSDSMRLFSRAKKHLSDTENLLREFNDWSQNKYLKAIQTLIRRNKYVLVKLHIRQIVLSIIGKNRKG